MLDISVYAGLLFAAGATDLTVYEKVYPHVLADAEALADWTAGTALVPYFERLTPALKDRFMAAYRRPPGRALPGRPGVLPVQAHPVCRHPAGLSR